MGNNCPTGSTAEVIGEQFGVAPRTVKNAEKFADAVDTIADTYGEEARTAILSENDLHRLRTVDYLNAPKVFLPGEVEGA